MATLKQRIEVLSREAVPPLIFGQAMPALKAQLFSSVLPAGGREGRGRRALAAGNCSTAECPRRESNSHGVAPGGF